MVPANHGFGRNHHEGLFQPNQNRRTSTLKSLSSKPSLGRGCQTFQNAKLLPKSEIFQDQVPAAAKCT